MKLYLCTNVGGWDSYKYSKVRIGLSQSPNRGNWGKSTGVTPLHLRKAAGWCKCLKTGIFGSVSFCVTS